MHGNCALEIFEDFAWCKVWISPKKGSTGFVFWLMFITDCKMYLVDHFAPSHPNFGCTTPSRSRRKVPYFPTCGIINSSLKQTKHWLFKKKLFQPSTAMISTGNLCTGTCLYLSECACVHLKRPFAYTGRNRQDTERAFLQSGFYSDV